MTAVHDELLLTGLCRQIEHVAKTNTQDSDVLTFISQVIVSPIDGEQAAVSLLDNCRRLYSRMCLVHIQGR